MTELSTKLATIGRGHSCFGSVNAPIYRASTILFEDFEAFQDAYHGRNPVNYGRQGNPITFELTAAINELVEADRTILTSSGLLAITTCLLAHLNAGDCVMIPDNVYGPMRNFCNNVLKRMKIEAIYYDPEITPDALTHMLENNINVTMLYMEAPGSMTFEMQDLRGLCNVAKQRSIATMLDYTWATPLFIKPFELGFDIAIQAITKYVAGHSDVVMGAISCSDAFYEAIHKTSYQLGNYVNGDECFLALRGLRTMELRLKQQMINTHEVMNWLESRAEVSELLTPIHKKHSGHALWQRDMQGGCSLFGVGLREVVSRAEISAFCNALKYFGMGYSWGGFESLIVPFKPYDIRTCTKHKWREDEWCMRLHIGLESPSDLIIDLENGFKAMQQAQVKAA